MDEQLREEDLSQQNILHPEDNKSELDIINTVFVSASLLLFALIITLCILWIFPEGAEVFVVIIFYAIAPIISLIQEALDTKSIWDVLKDTCSQKSRSSRIKMGLITFFALFLLIFMIFPLPPKNISGLGYVQTAIFAPNVTPTPSILTPLPTITSVFTLTPTLTPEPPTIAPTLTLSPTPTLTLSPSVTLTLSPTLTPEPPTATPTLTLTPTPTPTLTPEPPTLTLTPSVTLTPTDEPIMMQITHTFETQVANKVEIRLADNNIVWIDKNIIEAAIPHEAAQRQCEGQGERLPTRAELTALVAAQNTLAEWEWTADAYENNPAYVYIARNGTNSEQIIDVKSVGRGEIIVPGDVVGFRCVYVPS